MEKRGALLINAKMNSASHHLIKGCLAVRFSSLLRGGQSNITPRSFRANPFSVDTMAVLRHPCASSIWHMANSDSLLRFSGLPWWLSLKESFISPLLNKKKKKKQKQCFHRNVPYPGCISSLPLLVPLCRVCSQSQRWDRCVEMTGRKCNVVGF